MFINLQTTPLKGMFTSCTLLAWNGMAVAFTPVSYLHHYPKAVMANLLEMECPYYNQNPLINCEVPTRILSSNLLLRVLPHLLIVSAS
ncbi:hypothetical protein GDO81_016413 [Engystomops pustulosus]|uniref:Secreted protein n=1 Tax=Engystomops pustulosus TaxID=76066 RepID=A0AAV7AY31_ENGPU|nr:hypothetical protein GDO81_016413 [Engystomops pustulosus]